MELTVDVGKSGTRLLLRDHERVFESSGPGSMPEQVGGPAGAAYVVELIIGPYRQAIRAGDWPSTPEIESVIIGSTAIPPDVGAVAVALSHQWPAAEVLIFEDLVVGHAAALAGPGVLATLGTGIAVAAMDHDHQLHRIDGWGPDLGDRGSAWDLGRRGLRAAFAERDGTGPPTRLTAAAEDHLDGLDLAAATRLLASPTRVTDVCAFAQVVCDVVDPVTEHILDRCAASVVASIRAAAIRARVDRVALRGGLLSAERYRARITESVRAGGLKLCSPRSDVLAIDHDLLAAEPYRGCAAAAATPTEPSSKPSHTVTK